MRGFVLLLVGVVLCWLGIFLSLPAISAPELPSAFVRAEAAQEMDGGANAPLPDASYPITAVEEIQQTDRHPVNASPYDAAAEFILRGERLVDGNKRAS